MRERSLRRGLLGLFVGLAAASLAGPAVADERGFDDPALPAIRAWYARMSETAARHALAARDWDEAIARSEAGLAVLPDDDTLRGIRAEAHTERDARVSFERFVKLRARDPDGAERAWREIPESSVYRDEAAPAFDELRRTRSAPRIAVAEKLLRSRCRDIERQLAPVVKTDPGNEAAQWLLAVCRGGHDAPTVVARSSGPTLRDLKDPFEEGAPRRLVSPLPASATDPRNRDLKDPFSSR